MIGIATKTTVFLCGSKMSTFLYKNIFRSYTTSMLYIYNNQHTKLQLNYISSLQLNNIHQVYTKPYVEFYNIPTQATSSLNYKKAISAFFFSKPFAVQEMFPTFVACLPA